MIRKAGSPGILSPHRRSRSNRSAWTGALAAMIFHLATDHALAANAGDPSGDHCDADGVCLTVTLSPYQGDLTPCGEATSLSISPGDLVDFCYSLTNHSSVTMNWHSLVDAEGRVAFDHLQHALVPGETWQYHQVLAPQAAGSYSATWTSSDRLPNYTASVGGVDFVDISTSGTRLNLGNDAGVSVQLPFPFQVYGVASDELCVNNDGIVIFAFPAAWGASCSAEGRLWINAALPYALPSQRAFPLLMPLWGDEGGVFGNVYFGTVGVAPNRKSVVEWYQVESGYQTPGTGDATFELVFDEATGTLSFQYLDTTFDDPANAYLDHGGGATIGLAYDDVLYDQYSYQTPSISDQSSITWLPVGWQPSNSQASVSVSLADSAPTIQATPAQLSASVEAGTAGSASVTLTNVGSAAFAWYLENAEGVAAPSAASQVPSFTAYGFNYDPNFGQLYVGFADPTDPSAGTMIRSVDSDLLFVAGTFVNNDFSHQYLLGSGVAPDGEVGTSLYSYGVDDGSLQWIGVVSAYDPDNAVLNLSFVALAWDAQTSTLFAVAEAPDFGLVPDSALFAIDPQTATIRRVGFLPYGIRIEAMAVDANGAMSGYDYTTGNLFAIEKATADATLIGATGIDNHPFATALGFDGPTLYFNAMGSFYSIDRSTGTASLLGTLYDGSGTEGFAMASPGACAEGEGADWISLDIRGGFIAPNSSTVVSIVLDAGALAAGSYHGSLCVHGNDPTHRVIEVPIDLTVTPGAAADLVFADGFDG